jgi:ribosomal protein S6--L-glutamate ligase
MSEDKKTIGNQEWCAFPDLGISAIKARVDSGAKTSSIHAFNIDSFIKDGSDWISFEVHPLQRNDEILIRCECPVIDQRNVKSSSGTSETRYVINTPISLGANVWSIEVTLTDRDAMGYRMLLGREAMNDRLIIDPSMKCVLGKISTSKAERYYTSK